MHHRRQRDYDAQQARRTAGASCRSRRRRGARRHHGARRARPRRGGGARPPRLQRRRMEPKRPATIAGVESFAGRTGSTRSSPAPTSSSAPAADGGNARHPVDAAVRKLARDGALGRPVVINAGRGGLQVEADIVAGPRRRRPRRRQPRRVRGGAVAGGQPALAAPARHRSRRMRRHGARRKRWCRRSWRRSRPSRRAAAGKRRRSGRAVLTGRASLAAFAGTERRVSAFCPHTTRRRGDGPTPKDEEPIVMRGISCSG
jgi:hypothetical protein